MEFIKPGTNFDFMRFRKPVISASVVLVILSLASLFMPGPKYGLDFAGGTELHLKFKGEAGAGEIRGALEGAGYKGTDVVSMEGVADEYLIRVPAGNSFSKEKVGAVEASLKKGLGDVFTSMKLAQGGNKISLQLSGPSEENTIKTAIEAANVRVRSVNPFGAGGDHRYEAHLYGVADEIVSALQAKLGDNGPEAPRRVEWVGPKAGQQLRDAAINSLLYAIAFIMIYIAFRFDLRFAPGGVVAMFHDAVITLGVYVLFQKEVNLTTVAALLTILGYSINDTIVVYDRIRENMRRYKDKSLRELINLSTSQMFSRTIVTSLTTLLSVSAFFFFGTSVIRDIAFAMMIGILIGTYSSIYVAAPITEWMDRKLFKKA